MVDIVVAVIEAVYSFLWDDLITVPLPGGGPIGYINVEMDDSYDFGYALQRPFWGQGLVTEAGRAVVERVRADGLPYITATHDVNNPRSGAVMERLGMTFRYNYQEQWQPKNILVTFRLYKIDLAGSARVRRGGQP